MQHQKTKSRLILGDDGELIEPDRHMDSYDQSIWSTDETAIDPAAQLIPTWLVASLIAVVWIGTGYIVFRSLSVPIDFLDWGAPTLIAIMTLTGLGYGLAAVVDATRLDSDDEAQRIYEQAVAMVFKWIRLIFLLIFTVIATSGTNRYSNRRSWWD